MDTLRGNFEALDDSPDHEVGEEDAARETPPPGIGQDERRMQVRAYNHWASLLEDRNFPAIEDLEPGNLPDFGPFSVLLDFTAGLENPGIAYLGEKLADECDITATALETLADVPSRSLLSRITDHYMQILANQAPIGFEAEFVNQRGATILYRGILLPFSSDDETIDFIYGVINWKELADQHTSDELLLQVDQALEQKPDSAPRRIEDAPLTDWADGPGASAANDIDDAPAADGGAIESYPEEPVAFGGRAEDYLDDEELDEEGEEDEDDGLPHPKFGSLMSIGARAVTGDLEDDEDEDEDDVPGGVAVLGAFPLERGEDSAQAAEQRHEVFEQSFDVSDDVMSLEGFDVAHDQAPADMALPQPDPADMQLGDWLAAAREMAVQARTSEDRTRSALYDAIGRAYDFSLAAAENPQDFDEILADSGLSLQERAPMTPVVKLVFGADYDKTRLTEYAAALSHAHRLELPRGALGEFLRSADGGLKGVVKAERQLRREESGKADPAEDQRERLASRLREMTPVELSAIEPYGSEFALVMIRRSENGELAILGEVPEDAALIEKAAKKLVG